jgi:hypothetical protein
MRVTTLRLWGALSLAMAAHPAASHAQNAAPKPVVLKVAAESYSRYPSLEPVTAVSVQLTTPAEMYDLMGSLLADPANPKWDCAKSSSYRISVVTKLGGTTKTVRSESITSVVLEGNDDQGKRMTHCELGNPPQVQLIFRSDLGSNETVQVSLVGLPDGKTAQSDGTLKFSQRIVSFSATPQAAPSQKLTNGKTRDTGQLNVSFSDSDLFSPLKMPFNTYAKSSDLFSTDERDSQSSFSGTLGVQRGLLPRWFAPIHLEETMQGNQTASNLSSLTTLGITTLLPWSWSSGIFYNRFIQAPLPPDVTINNQYTHRINQNVTATTKLLTTDDYSLNPVASWSSIRLPWMCTVFGWMHLTTKVDPKDYKTLASQYCLGLQMDLGTYYLPLDLTAAKNQRVEGYGDVSILIPLSGLSGIFKIFPYLTSGDPAKSQIRIKYADAVNPANNYARSKHWTYGIEVIK